MFSFVHRGFCFNADFDYVLKVHVVGEWVRLLLTGFYYW